MNLSWIIVSFECTKTNETNKRQVIFVLSFLVGCCTSNVISRDIVNLDLTVGFRYRLGVDPTSWLLLILLLSWLSESRDSKTNLSSKQQDLPIYNSVLKVYIIHKIWWLCGVTPYFFIVVRHHSQLAGLCLSCSDCKLVATSHGDTICPPT